MGRQSRSEIGKIDVYKRQGLSPFKYSFEMNGIYYHFFKPELPLRLDILVSRLPHQEKRRFSLNRLWVKQFIKEIQPDIVNLIGTENPYYSITVLDIKNIPVFVSAQTVYTCLLYTSRCV